LVVEGKFQGIMMISEERRVLEAVCDELRTSRELTRTQWERLRAALGDRFDKAWQIVEQKRVKKYIMISISGL
jgi:hypothetical protein